MNQLKKRLKSYMPYLENVRKRIESSQKTLEGISSVVVIALSAFWMTQAIQTETFDFVNESVSGLIRRSAPFVVFCFLVTSNIYVGKYGTEEFISHWYNCFGKISFEVILFGLIHYLFQNFYFTLIYGLYASYAIYNYIGRDHDQKPVFEKVNEEEIDEKEAMKEVYRRIKARFPTVPSKPNNFGNRKIKRVKRM